MHAVNVDAEFAAGIAVSGVHDEFADFGIHVQFFLQLAFQALRQRFARLKLAAGKFPHVRQRLAFRPLGNKDFTVADDNAGTDVFHASAPSLADAAAIRAKVSSRPSTAAISVAPPAVVSRPLRAMRSG